MGHQAPLDEQTSPAALRPGQTSGNASRQLLSSSFEEKPLRTKHFRQVLGPHHDRSRFSLGDLDGQFARQPPNRLFELADTGFTSVTADHLANGFLRDGQSLS